MMKRKRSFYSSSNPPSSNGSPVGSPNGRRTYRGGGGGGWDNGMDTPPGYHHGGYASPTPPTNGWEAPGGLIGGFGGGGEAAGWADRSLSERMGNGVVGRKWDGGGGWEGGGGDGTAVVSPVSPVNVTVSVPGRETTRDVSMEMTEEVVVSPEQHLVEKHPDSYGNPILSKPLSRPWVPASVARWWGREVERRGRGEGESGEGVGEIRVGEKSGEGVEMVGRGRRRSASLGSRVGGRVWWAAGCVGSRGRKGRDASVGSGGVLAEETVVRIDDGGEGGLPLEVMPVVMVPKERVVEEVEEGDGVVELDGGGRDEVIDEVIDEEEGGEGGLRDGGGSSERLVGGGGGE
ncbi:hypothetical protein HDV00_010061 [Rhizophlyctis rosea]|nr:hypothetical protein HDV00_010061 [Rhizophlyctis rosea]